MLSAWVETVSGQQLTALQQLPSVSVTQPKTLAFIRSVREFLKQFQSQSQILQITSVINSLILFQKYGAAWPLRRHRLWRDQWADRTRRGRDQMPESVIQPSWMCSYTSFVLCFILVSGLISYFIYILLLIHCIVWRFASTSLTWRSRTSCPVRTLATSWGPIFNV